MKKWTAIEVLDQAIRDLKRRAVIAQRQAVLLRLLRDMLFEDQITADDLRREIKEFGVDFGVDMSRN